MILLFHLSVTVTHLCLKLLREEYNLVQGQKNKKKVESDIVKIVFLFFEVLKEISLNLQKQLDVMFFHKKTLLFSKEMSLT